MQEERQYWNGMFAEPDNGKPQYDDWLVKHEELLRQSQDAPIIDLGCGAGGDSLYLTERGYRVIACDWSEEALLKLRRHVPLAETRRVNLAERLPFQPGSARVIVADLSLHYFSWSKTTEIVSQLKRILMPRGALLCRVNSVKDTEFGAGQGEEIEPNYFERDGLRKRFFDAEQLERLFHGWQLEYMREDVMHRYHKPKKLWEIAASVYVTEEREPNREEAAR
ncbi:class I SAM-dependent methyltransferase [Paenibacillus doosanensis]|uniref:S-adenosylmethionine-dependent methyltransferase n=1 Tax=Paenibacillus konkukensis TaxID=2020716 RepID=A0ABY4RJ36_9BACL|nr:MULTISPECIES: class I SAM-dependent methyltransferase [Paenibacillus]MCS7461136.1 class I SAM-dependent methyltransferase [Paenibacillus doosanensis]UQZ81634.1 putative S-adenosylmethionine-dependent methyltransferase [Paenibacillus konkukensis]